MSDVKPFVLDFNPLTGRCDSGKVRPTARYMKDLVNVFCDTGAARALAAEKNPLVYEFYELDFIPEESGDLRFGTTILYPGQVAGEYFLTKGHFHTILAAAEVYYCLSGQGAMLMETPEGETTLCPVKAGDSLYVPGRNAHRSINTGDTPLVMFFAFRSDAGHDYGTIEQKGYRKLVMDVGGTPTLVDNPRWK
jgi:glucose-6-phosphate isomerase